MDVAISAFSGRPTILIVGGKNRNLDLTDTKKRLKSAKNLIKVIFIGETAPLLAAEQDPQKFAIATNLSAAVTLAHQMAKNHLIFKSYSFNPKTLTANFSYQGSDKTNYTEKIIFASPNKHSSNFKHLPIIASNSRPKNNPIHSKPLKEDTINLQTLLDRALFLSFILIGTSYYKSHPTANIKLDFPLDAFQANFFTTVYTHGLSQFIYENKLPLSSPYL